MQTEQRFRELLGKYLSGQCTPQEKAVMERWFEQGGQTENTVAPDKARILANIHRRQKRNYWRVAAIWTGILLAAGTGAWKTGIVRNMTAVNENTLADIKVETAIGQMKRIILPDSSVILLNANSVLSYDPDFRSNRRLHLSGEAFFTVTPDEAHPFTVYTKDSIRTTVLGTSFNISSYEAGDHTRIYVATGSVRVSKAEQALDVLHRQQAIHYDNTTQTYTRHHGGSPGWMKGHWEFDNCRFNDLACLLLNQYGITLTAERGMDTAQTHMNVNFNRRQSPQEIMDIFSSLAGCRYRFTAQQRAQIY